MALEPTLFVKPESRKDIIRKMSKYTTILWDLDQTILDFNRSQDYALRFSFEKLGLVIDDAIVALYAQINDACWKRLELGEITKEEVLFGRFRTLLDKLDIRTITPEDMELIYQDALGSVFFFRENSDKLLEQCKAKGYRQYIVTNGVNKTQANKVRISGIDKLVDGVFVSELIGYPKPQKEYFDACFENLKGIGREECILVGDSLTSDMKGGMNAGIDTCWYNPEGLLKPDDFHISYEIYSLWQLPDILSDKL